MDTNLSRVSLLNFEKDNDELLIIKKNEEKSN